MRRRRFPRPLLKLRQLGLDFLLRQGIQLVEGDSEWPSRVNPIGDKDYGILAERLVEDCRSEAASDQKMIGGINKREVAQIICAAEQSAAEVVHESIAQKSKVWVRRLLSNVELWLVRAGLLAQPAIGAAWMLLIVNLTVGFFLLLTSHADPALK